MHAKARPTDARTSHLGAPGGTTMAKQKQAEKGRKLTTAQSRKLGGLPTTSARIRYLTGLDWTRSEIATKLGIRYQHVRNVQITPLQKKSA